jgi:coenzyme F420 hydrogenase subunit beta
MKRRIATITDVAERHLCCGCGVCAFAQPDDVRMVDDLSAGRRPVVRDGADTSLALACCPGIALSHDDVAPPGADPHLLEGWGPVLEVWEGHASDPELRYAGSSGGVASALAHFGIADGGLGGAIHIRQRGDVPLLNETVLSRSRDDLLAASGSRYAPASPCDGLNFAVESDSPVVFIGKPCDVAATARARTRISGLDEKLAVTVAIFCAGAPSTNATIEMLGALGVDDVSKAGQIRYRGNGWPGDASVHVDGESRPRSMSYMDSWGGILEKHRPWRCRLCIDHTGEFADVAVGDPWYRPIEPGEHGSSLVVARTERGRDYVLQAMAAGHLELERVSNDLLPKSQPNLLATRGAIWGRLAASRLMGLPSPRFENMPTWPVWKSELSPIAKLRSFTGTAKRILQRRLHRRTSVRPAVELDETQAGWSS